MKTGLASLGCCRSAIELRPQAFFKSRVFGMTLFRWHEDGTVTATIPFCISKRFGNFAQGTPASVVIVGVFKAMAQLVPTPLSSRFLHVIFEAKDVALRYFLCATQS